MGWFTETRNIIHNYNYPNDNMSWILGALGAVGSVFSSIFGGNKQNEAIEKQNEANARENALNRQFTADQADLAYKRQRTLIAEQNQYNSASAQRARLQDAGINPNVMLDGGSAGTAQSSTSVTPGSAPSPIPMQAQRYEWMQNMAMQAAQIQNINADTKQKEADAGLTEKETAGQEIDNAYNQFNLEFDKKWREALAKVDLNNKDADTLLKDSQRLSNTLTAFRVARLTPLEAANLAQDTAKTAIEAAGIKWNTEQSKALYPLLVQKYGAEILVAKSQSFLNNSQANLNTQEANFNNATFNSRRNSLNFAAGLQGYNFKRTVMEYGVDKIKSDAFHDNASQWLTNYRYYMDHLPGSKVHLRNWDTPFTLFLDLVGSYIPGSQPPIMSNYNNSPLFNKY